MGTTKACTIGVSAAAMIAVCAGGSVALGDGDIWLYNQNGALSTGIIEEFPGLERTAGVRVFHADLGVDVDNAIDEPGLRVLEDGLDPAGVLGFRINRALRQWNGSDFSAVSAFTMTLGFESLSATTPLTDVATAGFTVNLDADGDLHDHYDFVLNAGTRVPGIWLLDVSFTFTGLGDSEPVWVLFSQDVSAAEVELAEEWAAANIPAPGAVALLGLAGLVAGRRRR